MPPDEPYMMDRIEHFMVLNQMRREVQNLGVLPAAVPQDYSKPSEDVVLDVLFAVTMVENRTPQKQAFTSIETVRELSPRDLRAKTFKLVTKVNLGRRRVKFVADDDDIE